MSSPTIAKKQLAYKGSTRPTDNFTRCTACYHCVAKQEGGTGRMAYTCKALEVIAGQPVSVARNALCNSFSPQDKPCPFCGTRPRALDCFSANLPHDMALVSCKGGSIECPLHGRPIRRKHWNMRAITNE